MTPGDYSPTGLHYGDRVVVTVDHPELPDPIGATFIGSAGGPHWLLRLDGTEALVNVPRGWVRRP